MTFSIAMNKSHHLVCTSQALARKICPVLCGFLISSIAVFHVNAVAKDVIRCEGRGADPITITMDARKNGNLTLHCISAKFIYDMTPCAPSNGFGLSAPTGSGALVDIVYRWQDYVDHLGGVTANRNKETELVFAGGFNSPGSGSGYTETWRFVIDRVTGDGKLYQTEDKKTTIKKYSCNRVKTKF
jgi:hypothetical protein